jgi:hypothetical protein
VPVQRGSGVRQPPLSKVMRFDHAAIVLLATLLVCQTARAQVGAPIVGFCATPGIESSPLGICNGSKKQQRAARSLDT